MQVMSEYKVYPKQFQYDKILISRDKCFTIMPFEKKFDTVYGIIKEAASENNITCLRADEMDGSDPIISKIISGILEAQYIIVDITGAKANVFYELGIAHSFRDARNILILKQKDFVQPFDISHLAYAEYNPENSFLLKDSLRTFFENSVCITDFQRALTLHRIIDYKIGGNDTYVDYIEHHSKKYLSIYANILNQNAAVYSEAELDEAFICFEKLIAQTLDVKNVSMSDGMIQIYIKLIANCELDEISCKFAERFDDQLLLHGMNDEMRLAKKTDLMLELAANNRLLNYCLPWIIDYFSRSKSSSIDLNRYKLENFLMTTTDEQIITTIINSVQHEDCHVREHMADIIGARHLENSFIILKEQLFKETNWFTIGSIVEAIGRVAPPQEGIDTIEKWITMKGPRMLEEKQFFLIKHLYKGIALLDTPANEHLNHFLSVYRPYLHEKEVGGLI